MILHMHIAFTCSAYALRRRTQEQGYARRTAPRPVHFGHEDVMSKQFQPPSPPAATTQVSPTIRQQLYHVSPAAVPLDLRQGDPHSKALLNFAGDVQMQSSSYNSGSVKISRMLFSDGSSCSCDAWCSRSGDHPCCHEWEGLCAWTAAAPL